MGETLVNIISIGVDSIELLHEEQRFVKINNWDNAFKNGPSKICGRPFKKLK